MNILERIRKYLDEIGEHPWPFGCKVDDISKEALTAWQMLSIEEKLAISRNNPFIAGRNERLKILRLQGYSQLILTELSGLSLNTIKRASAREKLSE